MFNSPFREEAASNRSERQQLDHLLWVTAPHERILLASAGIILAAFILWVVFGSITRSVILDGVLIQPGLRHEVTALEPGHLLEFKAAPGDPVASGEPIASQTVPELERELSRLQERTDRLTTEVRQSTRQDDATYSLLDAAHSALLQLETSRDTRSSIVSHHDGEIMALYANPGDYVSTGSVIAQIRTGGNRPPRAVLHITSDMAQYIKPGMSANVEITMPDGALSRVPGEVISRTAGAYPLWLATLLHIPAGHGHRVDVELDQTPAILTSDGMPCRVHINLGKSAPIKILTTQHL